MVDELGDIATIIEKEGGTKKDQPGEQPTGGPSAKPENNGGNNNGGTQDGPAGPIELNPEAQPKPDEKGEAKPESQQQQEQKPDWNTLSNEQFGVPFDQLKSVFEKGQNVSTLEGEVKQLKEQLTASPYKSPVTQQIDELLAKDVSLENAVKYVSADLTKMEPKDILVFQDSVTKPGMSGADISRLLDKKYGLGEYKVDDKGEEDGKLQMKYDAEAVKSEFAKIREQVIAAPAQSRDSLSAQQTEVNRKAAWTGKTETVLRKVGKVNFNLGDEKNPLPFSYTMPSLEGLDADVETLVEGNPELQANEEGMNTVESIIRKQAIINNLPHLLRSAMITGRSMSEKNWHGILHNVSLGGPKPIDTAAPLKSADEALGDFFTKVEGAPVHQINNS